MVGTALNRPAKTLPTAWVRTVFLVSPGVAMRPAATVVVAAVVPRISTTPHTATSVMTRQASTGNEMPQCKGCGRPNQAASDTDEKSTMPMQMAITKPTAMPMSGAAPCRKPLPNTLRTSVIKNVAAASARFTGSPNVSAPFPPAQLASALPMSPVPSTSSTAPEMNDGKITFSQSENSTNTTPHTMAATMQAPM